MSERERMEVTLSWNAYWAHPENTLVAMFHDEDIEVRSRAYKIVKELQQEHREMEVAAEGRPRVRVFRPPKVDWSVESYTGFLDLLDRDDWTCPPVFLDVDEDVLRAGVTEGREKDVFNLVGFPNTTRCVERAVQTNTQASAICQKEETREETLALLEYSREKMPVFRKKSDWVQHYN